VAIDSLGGGMDTARVRALQGDEAALRAERDAAAVRYLERTGSTDLLEVLGLVEPETPPALAPPPKPDPKPKPEPKRVVAYGECESCYRTYEMAAGNQRYCSGRCQKRAKRARECAMSGSRDG
jgi:hypothetical protein